MTLAPLDCLRLTRGRVLVLIAHPDDEALLCGGTIASLASSGCHVQVACFSDGAQGREAVFHEACEALGAAGSLQHDFVTNTMRLDGDLVRRTDTLIREAEPDCIITHTRVGNQNQDHIALHDATRLSLGRWHQSVLALAAEPPIASTQFVPTVFVDITESFDRKAEVVGLYRSALDRFYMTDDYLRVRAQWWGQVSGQVGALVEAFELIAWR